MHERHDVDRDIMPLVVVRYRPCRMTHIVSPEVTNVADHTMFIALHW